MAALLFAGVACDEYACQWTDEPFPEPVQTHELERSYPTDDGRFVIVLHAEDEWPPRVGATAIRIEARPDTDDTDDASTLVVDRPYLVEGELVAADAPTVHAIEPGEWSVEGIVLDAPGIWAVPIAIEQGDIDDSIEIRLEVVDDE